MHTRTVALGLLGVLPAALLGCGGSSSSGGIGQAADKGKASRVVEIRQTDFAFEPSMISVRSGETVTLRITNGGHAIHELFLGDEKAQDKHDTDMKAMSPTPMDMADMPNAVTVDPGATKEITWIFPKKGSVPFGCHEDDHYKKGMEGTVKVG